MKTRRSLDSFGCLARLETAGGGVDHYRIDGLAEKTGADLSRFPFSIRILLESLLHSEDGRLVAADDIARLAAYDPASPQAVEVPFRPARILLQDFTGVPAVADLAAMRSAVARLGKDAGKINPLIPVDLVIDHSLQVDVSGTADAFDRNARLEFERNRERYAFLRWGQQAFDGFRVVPPAGGICHQVNLEYLAKVVRTVESDHGPLAVCDTLVGTDSHTTMINGLGVLGWGVGGIEAEAVMLGQPLTMLAPAVVGCRLTGELPAGATATDLVLTLTELLRRRGVVGTFVEFFGSGLSAMTVPDRATVANMAPEYGATAGFFPVDGQTLRYLRHTGRDEDLIDLVERFCKSQGLFRGDGTPDPVFQDRVELDLASVRPSLAGPCRPQDRVPLDAMRETWKRALTAPRSERGFDVPDAGVGKKLSVEIPGRGRAELSHGAVVIAALTSCTNTSNPSVMLGAGLLARKAVEAGLKTRPWVKASLAPGSRVVTEYLSQTGLLPFLEKLGFHLVGYGCTTCIGNSGPLARPLAEAADGRGLVLASVLSGNRNFEGRINPHTRASFLASPPLVVAYGLAGTVDIDLTRDPLGAGGGGRPVYLRDIWPSREDIDALMDEANRPEHFRKAYDGIEASSEAWNRIPGAGGLIFDWREESTYIQEPPFFCRMDEAPGPVQPIRDARVLVLCGDGVTTDHISPAGSIPAGSAAAGYLVSRGVRPSEFNSYGSRRGNHHVMTRGTFANPRFRNLLAPGTEGGFTTHVPSGRVTTIFDAAMRYMADAVPVIVIGGKDYGMGSSRDWAAKGPRLLGVRAVIARSFERIHRSNLVGMGILPLQFREGESAISLGLGGREAFTVHLDDSVGPGREVKVTARGDDGGEVSFTVVCRLDSPVEVDSCKGGGILQTVLRRLIEEG
jgi:aconitate hydratase